MKKGFTLIELLAVIVVIGILSLIAIPTIERSIGSSRKKSYELQVSNIEEQVKNWATSNADRLPTTDGDTIYVTLDTLKKQGYFDNKAVIDPRTGSEMDGCITIQYDGSSKQYSYQYQETSCTVLKQEASTVTFVVKGIADSSNLTDVADLNNTYQYPQVSATASDGVIEVQGPIIKDQSTSAIVDSIDTSVSGKVYELTYSVYDSSNDVEKNCVITVTVADKSAPTIQVLGHSSSFSIEINTSSSFSVPVATTSDNSDGGVTVSTSGNVLSQVPGAYSVTYLATDSSGNRKTLVMTVNVVAKSGPSFTIVSSNGDDWTNQDITLTVDVLDEASGLASEAYSFDGGLTWQSSNEATFSDNQSVLVAVRDVSGNLSSQEFIIDKIDRDPPVLTVCGCSSNVGESCVAYKNSSCLDNPTATDNVTTSFSFLSSTCMRYPCTKTYTVVDRAGNLAVVSVRLSEDNGETS